MNYTAILTVYGRQENFFNQVKALKSQTIVPAEIIVFIDKHPVKKSEEILKFCIDENIQVVSVTSNVGVWGRFSLAMIAKSDFIFILDDDIIPGKKWFENSLKLLSTYRCVVGGVGVIFQPNTSDYNVMKRIGWVNPEDETTEADVIGHIWGASKSFFHQFWLEAEDNFKYPRSGEDIHFSWRAQQLGYKVLVPFNGFDKDNWSNLAGSNFGTDREALSLEASAILRMAKYLRKVRNKGFSYVSESDELRTAVQGVSFGISRGYVHYLKNRFLKILKWLKL
ncbi:glycosyltransferase family 2 protein [Schleiferiaceae bacterium]|nr:glycosyltransferase family 2 protein [Schleiferiaceae bacterium]